MKKPLLILITGPPASGKSTLAKLLAQQVHLPLLSRDELKEGYLQTLKLSHTEASENTGNHIYDSFFKIAGLFVSKNISLIIEAAFQDKLWRPKLEPLSEKADIKIIVCNTKTELIHERFSKRAASDAARNKFHGDETMNQKQLDLLTINYRAPKMNVPTLFVDTTENYEPAMKRIIEFVGEQLQF
ncbi:MAG TPA: AAA family ATPase [Hanamia sp.]|nr:AAA family ATPase [Hanamia sp.]